MNQSLAKFVKIPFTTSYGTVGDQYTQVLIVEDGAVKSIGEYLYRITRNEISVSDELAEKFAAACELCRQGGPFPCLCYFGDDLAVNFFK